jgi:type IV secretory pathway VirB4 component
MPPVFSVWAAEVFVLDIGRSFEKQAKLCGGQFIEFSRHNNLCLNPFSSIDASDQDSVESSLALLKPVLSQMIAPKSDTSDEEDAILSQALRAVWQAKGNNAAIDDIILYLQATSLTACSRSWRGAWMTTAVKVSTVSSSMAMVTLTSTLPWW